MSDQLNIDFLNAVIRGNDEEVENLLNQGADINYLNSNKQNALFISADRRNLNVFNLLLNYESQKINIDNKDINGETALMSLIKQDNYEKYIQKLIDFNVDINLCDKNNVSPLIKACGEKKPKIVEMLINRPDLDLEYAIPENGVNAFLMASAHGDFTTANILYKAGADINAVSSQGNNALINALFKNVQHYTKKEKAVHDDFCERLIDICDINYKAISGISAFWLASLMNKKNACIKMMEKGVDVNVWHQYGNESYLSALHLWSQIGDAEMIQKIIENGGDYNKKDSNQNTPIAYMFLNPKLRSVALNYNIDPNTYYYEKNSDKISILSLLVSSGDKQIELVKNLIEKGANVTHNEEIDIHEPIILSIISSAPKIVEELLNTNKINVDKIYKLNSKTDGLNLLSILYSDFKNNAFVAQEKMKKYYEALLKKKEMDEKNNVNSDLISKEQYEQIKKELESMKNIEENIELYKDKIFELLIKNNIKLNNQNEKGNTELFYIKNLDYFKKLTQAGSDIYHINNDGNDLLYYSVINGNNKIIQHLKNEFKNNKHKTVENIYYQLAFENVDSYINQKNIENGLQEYIKDEELTSINNINYQDEDGNTPLLVASANNLGYLVSKYIEFGADINLKNNLGETPLMHAIATENVTLVRYLIEKGANVNDYNNDGLSILEIASETKNQQIFKLLEENIQLNTKKIKIN